MRRVAVISDTHLPRGGRTLPASCVEQLVAADLILHTGDVISQGFLEELERLGPPVHAVLGNMDEAALRAALPRERVVEVEGARIGMVHIAGDAVGRGASLRRRFEGCDAVVYGHTHVPQVERFEGMWILNPGSPTERRRAPHRAMLRPEVERGEIAPTLLTL
jgi:putative phosphoesterase